MSKFERARSWFDHLCARERNALRNISKYPETREEKKKRERELVLIKRRSSVSSVSEKRRVKGIRDGARELGKN